MARWQGLLRGWLRNALLLAFVLMHGQAVLAHELSMAEFQMREVARGDFIASWGAGEKSMPADSLTPLWPEQCRAEGGAVRCGERGLSGVLGMKGLGDRFSAVLVRIHWLDGQSTVHTLSAGQTTARLYGSSEDRRGFTEIASAYAVLGIEHILSGFDHLLFVIGLLFLVGFKRRLVGVITAFTVAHSLTLALSALGLLTLRPPPVEAVIALSIMLVAAEALHQKQTLSRQWPALVALLFGLVHGLGFAGALKEIGLPENHLAVALLTFNLGVEAGQLLVVGAAGLLVLALNRWVPADGIWLVRTRLAALYGIGGLAAFWTLERASAIVA